LLIPAPPPPATACQRFTPNRLAVTRPPSGTAYQITNLHGDVDARGAGIGLDDDLMCAFPDE
jgi:hypothetical protein